MSKILAGFAALTLMGVAALPLPANAAERHGVGITKQAADTTDVSSRHRRWHRRHVYRHYYGPRRYWGPRYGYYGYPYGYPYHGYYRPAPFVGFGIGPFGFRVF